MIGHSPTLGVLLALAITTATAAEARRPPEVGPALTATPRNLVLGRPRAGAPLIVFLPGTNGSPENNRRFLDFLSGSGSPVIGLAYANRTSVSQICASGRRPDCARNVRHERLYGTDVSPDIDDGPRASIVAQLRRALDGLRRSQPDAGWSAYLTAGGDIAWPKIVVSGFSQGAGMAAMLAQDHEVARVVLLSSPWDQVASGAPAPWLGNRAATPRARWWAAYHVQENTAPAIRRALAALQVPPTQVIAVDLDVPPARLRNAPNPYHGAVIADPRYGDVWRRLYSGPVNPKVGSD